MVDQKTERMKKTVDALSAELKFNRIKVSEAAKLLKDYCKDTKDPLIPSIWGRLDDKENPYAKDKGKGCLVL
ncbi:hypothetical protein CAOG_08125 [Capsaspora owczarzaki ATCC 30864]|uniref:Guanine nucleotide-binding protein subunit gamma n=1 Tax=Capsaspora owczarzaki (strain ATCC 30864) TaxID=595528 RepID=A0A0D2UT43_CAPO3|nr:hypothetical protein CAOG_08125 [Capsaspora owczarzaki ATCC 30864]KJE98106.1 hypothetical protein CAOG_008125 [Capsaspora owczarzaki ATCC 30864]|eukprot:XP_004342726.1 hypothetical protein CAOG_08125 [Capsaspora owczarzaki ATCC 30864]